MPDLETLLKENPDKKVFVEETYLMLQKISTLDRNLVIPPEHSSIMFYSRFESGNLLKAIKVEAPLNESEEYDLYL